MIMLVDLSEMKVNFEELNTGGSKEQDLGVSIKAQHGNI